MRVCRMSWIPNGIDAMHTVWCNGSMSKLLDHLRGMPDATAQERFAEECGTTIGHLRNVAYGHKSCGPALARAIEERTEGAVTRRDMRPDDAHLIWPDIKTTA